MASKSGGRTAPSLYPRDGREIETLFKHADQALYVAKAAGRNRLSYFTPEQQQAAQLRMRLGTKVVAEGVETAEQADLLPAAGSRLRLGPG